MAITIRKKAHVLLEHEPGQWVDLTAPTFAMKFHIQAEHGDDPVTAMLKLITASVTAWSYPEPVTAENIEALDDETWMALWTAFQEMHTANTGGEPDESPLPASGSLPTTLTEKVTLPTSG